jgi:hypothetical protein
MSVQNCTDGDSGGDCCGFDYDESDVICGTLQQSIVLPGFPTPSQVHAAACRRECCDPGDYRMVAGAAVDDGGDSDGGGFFDDDVPWWPNCATHWWDKGVRGKIPEVVG